MNRQPNWGVPSHNSPDSRVNVSRVVGGLTPAAGVSVGVAIQGASNQGSVYRRVPDISAVTRLLDSRIYAVRVPSTNITLDAVVHTRGQGSLTINPSVVLGAVVHTRGQGALQINPSIALGSVVNTRAVGSISVGSAINLASITHTRGQGSLTINPSVPLGSVTHTRGQGSIQINPSVSLGSVVHTRGQGDITVSTAEPPRLGVALQGGTNQGGVTRAVDQPVQELRADRSHQVAGLNATISISLTSIVHGRAIGDITVTAGAAPATPPGLLLQGSASSRLVSRAVPLIPAQEPKETIPSIFVFVYSAPPIYNVIVQGGTNQGFRMGKPVPAEHPAVERPKLVKGYAAVGETATLGSIVHSRGLGNLSVSPSVPLGSIVHSRGQGDIIVTQSLTVTLGSIVHTRGQGALIVSPTAGFGSVLHNRAVGSLTINTQVTLGAITHVRGVGDITVAVPGAGGDTGSKMLMGLGG